MNPETDAPVYGIDFWDVDHTVLDGASGIDFLITAIRESILSSRILFSVPKFYFQYRFGEMDFNEMLRSFGGMSGITRDVIFKTGRLNFERKLRNKIFSEAEKRIRYLKSAGRKVVLISSSFNHVIEPLAEYLSVDHLITNSMVFKDGITTGEYQRPVLYGEEKKTQALALMVRLGISPGACSFYSDSITDLSLLELIGKPVAVNPDKRLKRIARQRGWEILYFR
jgi:HAD superfamily hydrolase (TIGR01490 family)